MTLGSNFLAKREDLLLQEQVSARKTLKFFGRDINFTTGGNVIDNDQARWATPAGAPSYTGLDLLNPMPVYDPGLPYAKNRDVFTNTKYVFLEGFIHLTKRLTVTGAGRIDRIENTRFDEATQLYTEKTYRPKTGRYGLIYTVYRDINLYVSKSTATQPVTPLVSITGAQTLFSLQPTRAWETGVKALALRGRLDATLAYFSMGKSDILTQNIVEGVRIQQQIGKQLCRRRRVCFRRAADPRAQHSG